jgi:glyoxylate carboligase
MGANQIGGHAAISILETYGVDTVFGIPGVHTLDLYRGIADRKMRISVSAMNKALVLWPTAMREPRASRASAA